MATLLDKWLKVKKSGHFHRNWQVNKLRKQLKNESKNIIDECNINLEKLPSPQPNLVKSLEDSLEASNEQDETWLNEYESGDEENSSSYNEIVVKLNNNVSESTFPYFYPLL